MKNSVDGVGMTSRRTRDRMIDRLRKEGIKNENVLAAMSQVPRHLFIDEAFATRAYDDVSLPIGFVQSGIRLWGRAFSIQQLGELGSRR